MTQITQILRIREISEIRARN